MFVAWAPPDEWSYSYLLGAYLGDGYVSDHPRHGNPFLAFSLDAAYPGIADECWSAATLTTNGERVTVRRHKRNNCLIVQCSSPIWPAALPQHGRGKKHDRPIVLAGWQREIVDREPQAFLRGLIHSDGCRTVNRFKTKLPSGRVAEYEYTRYFFSNLSADIRGLFCEYCEKLGIRWTQSNHRNISVSHRRSVRCWTPSSGQRSDALLSLVTGFDRSRITVGACTSLAS